MNTKVLKLSVTNSYLIGTGDKYVLIDTGYESDWERFCKRLKEAGVSLSDISHLVLTHHHDDHCGLLKRVLQANQDIRIVMSDRAKELLAKGENDRTHGVGPVSRRVNLLVSGMRRFSKQWRTHTFPVYASRASDILIQGETNLDDIGIRSRGRIIETPGHTIDSISVLFEDGSCFVGDAAANFLHFAGTKYCVILVEDIEEYYRSWTKLVSAGAREVYPAHGKPFAVTKLTENLGKIKSSDIVPLA